MLRRAHPGFNLDQTAASRKRHGRFPHSTEWGVSFHLDQVARAAKRFEVYVRHAPNLDVVQGEFTFDVNRTRAAFKISPVKF